MPFSSDLHLLSGRYRGGEVVDRIHGVPGSIEQSCSGPYCPRWKDVRRGRWRDDMDEQRLIDIEMRIAYHEQTLAELDQVLTDQQAQLTRLQNLAVTLGERIQSLAEGPEPTAEDEQKPPHY